MVGSENSTILENGGLLNMYMTGFLYKVVVIDSKGLDEAERFALNWLGSLNRVAQLDVPKYVEGRNEHIFRVYIAISDKEKELLDLGKSSLSEILGCDIYADLLIAEE